jgi:hypothetical protein
MNAQDVALAHLAQPADLLSDCLSQHSKDCSGFYADQHKQC